VGGDGGQGCSHALSVVNDKLDEGESFEPFAVEVTELLVLSSYILLPPHSCSATHYLLNLAQ